MPQVRFALKVVRHDNADTRAAFRTEVNALMIVSGLPGLVQIAGALPALPAVDGLCAAGRAGILLQLADMGSLHAYFYAFRHMRPGSRDLPLEAVKYLMACVALVRKRNSAACAMHYIA